MKPRRRDTAPKEPPAPGRITAIAEQQRDNARMNISIDGKFAFGLHADVVLDERLHVGEEISALRIEELLRKDEVKRAITAALNLIAFRSRASGELQRALQGKGYSSECAEAAVNRMLELGYLNDSRFAERWIENRQEHRPRSVRMLKQELRQKGIDAETIGEAISTVEIDEYTDALALASKKASTMAALDQPTRHRRISGFLARRGYGFDVIRRVLEAID